MSRLLSRFGMRAFAIGLLVLGLTGGFLLSADRQTQRRNMVAGDAVMAEADEMHQLKIIQAESWRLGAPQRAAQADAQEKANAAAQAAAGRAKAADDAVRASRSKPRNTPSVAPSYNVPSSCSQYTGNQGIGCGLLLEAGFGLDQMPCLVNMWNKESGWRTTARNPSGAYGIPQAYPGSKMSVYGADYLTNPVTQIKWGLSYIKGRYKTPCGAWSYWQAHHSY
ncbi:transglycosylase SLT domain-containing protein [Rugosimonospora africana]|uniref:aggregation-promoting factor C-terminal-like domain-containing protein n=1 Tax=Rugosimonospora africana TaxID=556532 RepID=UPI001EF29D10|nr:transglycosylase SLT domain-containing protein [Rugosimonospora africana]